VTSLILIRARAFRPWGQWQDEDYDVLVDGKVVGRIYENASVSAPPDMRWFWSVTGNTGRDERHRRDARRSVGEV
jgi:hypothetical protein